MITLERLRQVLEYDPETGLWRWLRPDLMNKKPISEMAGTISVHGYRIITYEGKKYRASRLAWFYMTGAWPEEEIDHKDRVMSNDKWSNLRAASRSENALNRDLQSNNTSGARGVSWNTEKGKWYAQIKKDGVSHYVGWFDFLDEAIAARDAVAQDLHGDFATLNRDPFCQEDLYDLRRFLTV